MKKKLKYSFTGTNICEGDRILVKRRKKVNTENSNNKQQHTNTRSRTSRQKYKTRTWFKFNMLNTSKGFSQEQILLSKLYR